MSGGGVEKDAPVVLDLDDRYFDGQSLPDALRDYVHVHSMTGVCVKAPGGKFCQARTSPAKCSCGSDATSLNPAEVVVHRTDGPCTIEPTS